MGAHLKDAECKNKNSGPSFPRENAAMDATWQQYGPGRMMVPVDDEAFLSTLAADVKAAMCMLPASVTQHYHVPLMTTEDGFELCADIYCRDRRPCRPRPALIYMHDWAGGRQPKLCADSQASWLALVHDWLVVALYYRQPGDATFPAALCDLKCCLRWVRSMAGEFAVDPDRVIVMGSSAGSQWAGLAAATEGVIGYEGLHFCEELSDRVNLAVLKSAIYELNDFRQPGSAIRQVMGDIPAAEWASGSPYHRLHAGMPPVFSIHGDADTACPVTSAIAAHERLRVLGVPAKLVVLPGRGHGLAPTDLVPMLEAVVAFTTEQLG